MDDQGFRKLVSEMRHAQKEFFRTKSNVALDSAKACEKKVDKELLDGEQSQKQRQLFRA